MTQQLRDVLWVGTSKEDLKAFPSKVRRDMGCNIFADLGFAHPEEELVWVQLTYRISKAIEQRGRTQSQAADVLETSEPKVSALMNGHLSEFSIECLMRYLVALGADVEIVVTPARNGGSLHVREGAAR